MIQFSSQPKGAMPLTLNWQTISARSPAKLHRLCLQADLPKCQTSKMLVYLPISLLLLALTASNWWELTQLALNLTSMKECQWELHRKVYRPQTALHPYRTAKLGWWTQHREKDRRNNQADWRSQWRLILEPMTNIFKRWLRTMQCLQHKRPKSWMMTLSTVLKIYSVWRRIQTVR